LGGTDFCLPEGVCAGAAAVLGLFPVAAKGSACRREHHSTCRARLVSCAGLLCVVATPDVGVSIGLFPHT
jgi:hypothetical protein